MLIRSNHQDPLSMILSTLHLSVDISVNAQFCGGWLFGHKTEEKSFHLISHGECVLELDAQPSQQLQSGDLVIFMQKVSHRLIPKSKTLEPVEKNDYTHGINPLSLGILCGSFAYDNNKIESLMRSLPPVLVIKNEQQPHSWVNLLIQLIQQESMDHGLGSDLLIKQFTESLIVYAIRYYIKLGDFDVGLLKLISDKKLMKALYAIQNDPHIHWTVELLAHECAMSRTAFATHFKYVSGWSPMEYVTWWRMQLAWSMLSEGESIVFVSDSVGYRSEAAFSRAFKKAFGVNPGETRTKYKKNAR